MIGAFQENHTKPFNKEALLFNSVEISQPILAHQLFFLQPVEHRWFAMIFGISPSIPLIHAVEQIHSSSFTHWILYIIFTHHSYSISHILVFVGSPWCSKYQVLEGFYLAPVLWFQVASKTPPLQLQDSEVAAFRWVPLKTLVPEAVTGIGRSSGWFEARKLEKYIVRKLQKN